MISNPCPLCSNVNCIEEVDFQLGNSIYHGFKCNRCHSMLYSYEDTLQDRMRKIEANYHDLLKRMDQ